MSNSFTMLITAIFFLTISTSAHAGKWKTGQGATIEDALLNAIDNLNDTSKIESIDRKTRNFKTTCKPNGALYSVRMHGNYYTSGGAPDNQWVKRQAAKLALKAKICPVSKNCRTSLRDNVEKWHAGMISANDALVAIEGVCP